MLIRNHYLYAGDIFTSSQPTQISTVLGSCVSVCLWEPRRGIGGINHFVGSVKDAKDPQSNKYGEVAMGNLIKRMKNFGVRTRDLRCRVFGGGKVIDLIYDIGADNIRIARAALEAEGIQVMQWDVGGDHGRSLTFNTRSGVAIVRKVRSIKDYFPEKSGDHAAPLANRIF